jgi:hypothetical protein
VLVDHERQSPLGLERAWRRREAQPDVVGNGVYVETAEGDLAAEALDSESVDQRGMRMLGPSDFRRPVGGNHQQARRFGTPCKGRDPVERRDVAPVQVFETQDERNACGHRFSGVGELTEQALARRPCNHALEPGTSGERQQGWQLREPRRSVLPQRLDVLVAARLPAQARQRLQERLIWLAGPIVLDALAPGGPESAAPGGRSQQLLDNGCLPDAGLTRHEQELPNTLLRQPARAKQLLHHGSAADEPCAGAS